MKHFHKNRLKKLAEHLMSGKLGHKKFSFNHWNIGISEKQKYDTEAYKCGYMGCAIGECPIVFKKDWKFDGEASPVLRKGVLVPDSLHNRFIDAQEFSGMEFFGLNLEEFRHLFIPNEQNPIKFGGRYLDGDAKAPSVAKNIIAFLAKQV